MSDEIVIPGSVEWLGEMVKTALLAADEAKRRYYNALDAVDRHKRDLSSAQERLSAAEREYHEHGRLMQEMWSQLRGELEAARPARTLTIEHGPNCAFVRAGLDCDCGLLSREA